MLARSVGLCAVLVYLASGCATSDRRELLQAKAAGVGLSPEYVQAGRFLLTTFVRITQPDQPLNIYIEGDGLAWISRNEASLDPTPREATGLSLAIADGQPNVVYLARPCQFTPMTANPACETRYWTDARFAPEVIAAMNQAVDHFAARAPIRRLHLIGYSGGGAVAILLAARRADVASIRTVAGNLDVEFINRLHRVSPMPASENPIDSAQRVSSIAQIHFSGEDDKVVPPEVAQRFVAAVGGGCAKARLIPVMTHTSDWGKLWPALLAEQPAGQPRP